MNHRFGLPTDPYGLRNFVDFVIIIECTCSRTVHAEKVTPFVICQALQRVRLISCQRLIYINGYQIQNPGHLGRASAPFVFCG